MAFCPECGKAVTPDAAACVSCGKQLRVDDKKLRAARFQGTMMMTAPEVKAQAPANTNAEASAQQANVVAAAAGGRREAPVTSPRLGAPIIAARSSRPPHVKQGENQLPHAAGPTLGRQNAGPQAKATMIGPGVSPEEIAQAKATMKGPGVSPAEIAQAKATMKGPGVSPAEIAQAKAAAKAHAKNATMIGAGLVPTTPRSKPPAAALKQKSDPAPAGAAAESGRPPAARQTTPQGSNSASVRAVQSVPVSPAPAGPAAKAAAAPHVKTPAEQAHAEAPPARAGADRNAPDPARMVQAIPEVVGTVVDPAEQHNARTVPREYLPGDPMAPQPPAAARPHRPRPFAPDEPEEEGKGNYILLYWAVCVAVVAAVSALAFRLF